MISTQSLVESTADLECQNIVAKKTILEQKINSLITERKQYFCDSSNKFDFLKVEVNHYQRDYELIIRFNNRTYEKLVKVERMLCKLNKITEKFLTDEFLNNKNDVQLELNKLIKPYLKYLENL